MTQPDQPTYKATGKKTSPAYDNIDFHVYTGQVIKTVDYNDPTLGPLTFNAIGSSELSDLENDRMQRSVLKDMTTLPKDRPVFANHDYTYPESVMAKMLASPTYDVQILAQSTRTAPAGTEMAFVKFPAQIMDNNPRAMQSWGYLERGLQTGISVGIQITEYEVRLDQKSGKPIGLDIIHGEPLEFSMVGIPCNTESWVMQGVKSIFKKYATRLPEKEEDALYMIRCWGDFDGVDALFLYRLNKQLLEPHGLTIVRLPVTEPKKKAA